MDNESQNSGNFLSSQEPHQKEEMDQAEQASRGSYTLEPEKGMTEAPDGHDNIKQARGAGADITPEFDTVSEVDLDADDNTITEEDLQALDGRDDGSTL